MKPFNNPRGVKIFWLTFMNLYQYMSVCSHISLYNLFNIRIYLFSPRLWLCALSSFFSAWAMATSGGFDGYIWLKLYSGDTHKNTIGRIK